MLGRRGGLINLYVFIADALMLLASYGLSRLIYRLVMHTPSISTGSTLLIILLALFVVAVFFNANSQFLKRSRVEEVLSVLKTAGAYILCLGVLIFLTRSYEQISRIVTVLTVALFFILDYFARLLLKKLLKRFSAYSMNRMLLVTSWESAARITRKINDLDSTRKVTCLAIYDEDHVGETVEGVPVKATLKTMFEYAKERAVDEVLLDLPYENMKIITNCINEFESMGIVTNVAHPRFEDAKSYIRTAGEIANIPVTTFSQTVQDSEKLVIKRLFDLLIGFIGTILTGVLTIFLAPAIKLESKGPVFFKQKRVGRNGRIFYMYKFRSMYQDAEKRKAELMKQNEMNGLMFKMTDDPRITKVGKFIRTTSLDEFPQFINILKGDMSLIGTRPPTLDEFKQYKEHHKRRLSMKPGLTGMWQVSGRSEITDFEEVVRLDCYYIDHWSLWLDLKIFLKTFVAVFRRKGSK